MPLNRTARRVRTTMCLSRMGGGYTFRLYRTHPGGATVQRVVVPAP